MKTLTINLATINGETLTTLARTSDGITFNLAVGCAYLSGQTTIPIYTDNEGNEHEGGKVKKENKLSYSKIANLVDYSKATVTAWVNAIKKIIEEGYFDDFNEGTISFNADKINFLLDEDNEALLEHYGSLGEAMKYSFANLKKELKRIESKSDDADNGEDEADANGEGEGTTDGEVEKVVFMYEDKLYKVDKSALEKLLETAEVVEAE